MAASGDCRAAKRARQVFGRWLAAMDAVTRPGRVAARARHSLVGLLSGGGWCWTLSWQTTAMYCHCRELAAGGSARVRTR